MKITGFADGRNVVIERQSAVTPSNLIAVETGRLTPATVTVVKLDAAFRCDDDVPTNITSDLSAFNKSLSANQYLMEFAVDLRCTRLATKACGR